MTHKQKVLQLLADNQPHSHMEGYRLGVMLHSRAADLRKDGYTVKCWHENGAYWYQLFGTVRSGDVAPDGLADGLSPVRTALDIGGPPELPLQTPESAEADAAAGPGLSPSSPAGATQLTVFESAA